nr:PREDICTED: uncharacterized protein LOC105663902 [Megachile rotundata]
MDSFDLVSRYSSYSKLLRVIAYCIRFIANLRRKIRSDSIPDDRNSNLTATELLKAEKVLVGIVQRSQFAIELESLLKNKPACSKGRLTSLNPFVDETGLIRVGGRLKHARIDYEQKHPMILPTSHPLTTLIVRHEHTRLLHAGSQRTLASLRNKFWILSGILINSADRNSKIQSTLAQEGIEWHLIPPYAPHFGGLWEGGVKQVKTHLRRVIGDQRLTYEELYTTLTQIEACLNSRPLHPLSSDPTDLTPLTSGHFLIGDALTTLPQPDVTHINQNRLNRFQLIHQMVQHFWKRWHQEYLHELQQRHKWKLDSSGDVKIGALVLIKEDNIPPMRWRLGRITELHHGLDDITRVVTLKTIDGLTKRSVTKICLLPNAENSA